MADYQYKLQFHRDMCDIQTPCRTLNKARILGAKIQPVIRGMIYHLFSSSPLEELTGPLVVEGVSLTYLRGQTVREDLPKLQGARE